MTIDWPLLAGGLAMSSVAGAAVAWKLTPVLRKRVELRALTRRYSALSGQYLAYRRHEDGSEEPTGGWVELLWQPKQGLLEASAFQANGHPEWHSYLTMSEQYPGAGIGHYNHSDSIHGGVLQILYSRQARSFHVTGTTPTRSGFVQCWKAKEKVEGGQAK
jgi:hypothetical protein